MLFRTGNQISPSPGSGTGWEHGVFGEQRQTWVRVGMQGGSTQGGTVERLPWGLRAVPGTLCFARQPEPPCPSPCNATGTRWDQDVPFLTVFASESRGGAFWEQGLWAAAWAGCKGAAPIKRGGCQPPSSATFLGTRDMLGAGSINPTWAFGKSKDLKLTPA